MTKYFNDGFHNERRRTCTRCYRLLKHRKHICWPDLYSTDPTVYPQVMVITESPGDEENKAGVPLLGKAGQEARHNLSINGITGKGVWLDNIIKCWPPGNRDPYTEEIEACTTNHLIPSILLKQPQWIITMGRLSTRFFLGDVNMELVHGIPHTVEFHGLEVVVIPTYHPAAIFHSPEQMINFQMDMKVAGGVIRGDIAPHPPVDEWKGREDYRVVGEEELVKVHDQLFYNERE